MITQLKHLAFGHLLHKGHIQKEIQKLQQIYIMK